MRKEDLIKEANKYLNKEEFDNSFCFATMALKEDDKNYDSYLIRFLSSYEIKSLKELDKLNVDYTTNQHFIYLLSVSPTTTKKQLLQKANKNKEKYIITNSKEILKKENNIELINEINNYIEELQNNNSEESKTILNKLNKKRKEIIYSTAINKIESDNINTLQ